MAVVWVFAESREQTLELLSAARNLGEQLGTNTVAFALNSQLAQEYISHGSDEVLLLPPLAKDQPLESYVPVMVEAARKEEPDIFFIGGTRRGKEMAARIAARLNTGLCSGCIAINLDKGKKQMVMERMVFGGTAIQTIVCSTKPQMVTIPPRTFDPAPLLEGKKGKVTELPAAPPSPVTVIERTPKVREAVDITEAKIVVCTGRGIDKKEDLALVRELADVLGGEVGCSRPIAEELRWLPEDVYLGISGKKVKPNLYIGVGISGQVQHITGIRDSKVICGINRDENAPIFNEADYGIVGDLYDVVPKLIKEFRNALKM